jgi:UDP-N-acetylglucosamine enolpyruvyl transferase
MKLMHTKLPEFIKKMKEAAIRGKRPKDIEIKGLENLTSAKMQSLRTGRIEQAVSEIAERDSVEKLEINVIPRVPETMHTAIVKGLDKEGKCLSAILEVVNILHPTEEAYLLDCDDVDDRRPKIGLH